jgi:hypothetical protein
MMQKQLQLGYQQQQPVIRICIVWAKKTLKIAIYFTTMVLEIQLLYR